MTTRYLLPIFTIWMVDAHSISSDSPAVMKTEFLFETAAFASAHASTIVEAREGLVAAWFGGTREGASDVGISLSRHAAGQGLITVGE
jgi:predicted neuraminidase